MQHLAAIQSEFIKEARKWNDLSFDEQRKYLKKHPKSKRRLTGKVLTENQAYHKRKVTNTIKAEKIATELSNIPNITNVKSSDHGVRLKIKGKWYFIEFVFNTEKYLFFKSHEDSNEDDSKESNRLLSKTDMMKKIKNLSD